MSNWSSPGVPGIDASSRYSLPRGGGMPGENLTALVGGGLAAAIDQSRIGEFLSGHGGSSVWPGV